MNKRERKERVINTIEKIELALRETFEREFIRFCLNRQIFRFGEFPLKSGRISPYMFDVSRAVTGESLSTLGRRFSQKIIASKIVIQQDIENFPIMFGMPYKGILTVVASAILMTDFGKNHGWCFVRKEEKDHGEGGKFVGANLKDRDVIIMDDVITSGGSILEAIDLVEQEGGRVAAVVVAFDRGEEGTPLVNERLLQKGIRSAISIAGIDNLIEFLKEEGRKNKKYQEYLGKILEYRKT